ncbi:MAG: transglutaminase domain-containing protein [Sedimentisphaerales bacterium]|nr:transglutaminase domain-containing protein [Sedimentisphaerales bacterium]
MPKSIRCLILVFVLQIVTSAIGDPEEKQFTTWNSVQRTIKYEYRVMNPTTKTTGKIDVYLPLPLETPRQEIHYLHLSENGKKRIFTDVHGQKLVHYCFDRLEAGQWIDISFIVGLTLRNMRWNDPGQTTTPNAPVLTAEQKERYLTSETNYSMETDLMRQTAADLTRDANSDFDKLVRIHDHIISKIRYVRDNTWDPAAVVLERGTGSCSEYNYVLSGLCRLAGLPTRCVGGTSNGFRPLPTTDTVYHRWTEVFLNGYGWFPADCSRDANPIRGKRSHFGRVYVDALAWCRQAGGEEDSLGWDYRAHIRVDGDNPDVRTDHRTRWFEYYPEAQIKTAFDWFLNGAGSLPEADLLECALLHWDKASLENRLKMIRVLASAGRNECLRRTSGLPETDRLREMCARELCDSPKLAETVLKKSRDLYQFRSWFRDNESLLIPMPDDRFKLAQKVGKKEVPFTTNPPSKIWEDLAAELVSQFDESVDIPKGSKVVIMPVEDQTLAGLSDMSTSIHSTLKELITGRMDVRLIDEIRFNRLMEEQGPGQKEYWLLANEIGTGMPLTMTPDVILVPLCITEQSNKEKGAVLYHLEFKALELSSRKYTTIVARQYHRSEVGG